MKTTKQALLLKQDSENVAMLMPLGTALEQPTEDIWKNYNPEKVRQALDRSAGIFTEDERKELLADIRDGRSQGAHRRTF